MESVTRSTYTANDGVDISYIDTQEGSSKKPVLVLLHGFTGSNNVWQRNLDAFSQHYRVIVPDLRGHGNSGKPKHGYHVSRLAMDLNELLDILNLGPQNPLDIIGGSLGCAIIWSYAELFGTGSFKSVIFVDQSPLQNVTLDGWTTEYSNRGMNSPAALAALQTTLALSPEIAHRGTTASCLAYRSHPLPTDSVSQAQHDSDEAFFLSEAMKGNGEWYGKLMADHTALDWRDSIEANFGRGSLSKTKVLVVTSSRSGCFPQAGPLKVVEFINGNGQFKEGGTPLAKGVVVDWGGHWCYWEDSVRFNKLCLEFLLG